MSRDELAQRSGISYLHIGTLERTAVSLRLFSMVVIGGLGSIPGAILGAVYVRGAEFFLSGGWAIIASGAGLLALLLVTPGAERSIPGSG